MSYPFPVHTIDTAPGMQKVRGEVVQAIRDDRPPGMAGVNFSK